MNQIETLKKMSVDNLRRCDEHLADIVKSITLLKDFIESNSDILDQEEVMVKLLQMTAEVDRGMGKNAQNLKKGDDILEIMMNINGRKT